MEKRGIPKMCLEAAGRWRRSWVNQGGGREDPNLHTHTSFNIYILTQDRTKIPIASAETVLLSILCNLVYGQQMGYYSIGCTLCKVEHISTKYSNIKPVQNNNIMAVYETILPATRFLPYVQYERTDCIASIKEWLGWTFTLLGSLRAQSSWVVSHHHRIVWNLAIDWIVKRMQTCSGGFFLFWCWIEWKIRTIYCTVYHDGIYWNTCLSQKR